MHTQPPMAKLQAKASRLAENDHCRKVNATRVFTVASEHRGHVFLVVVTPDGTLCSCEAGVRAIRCSHSLAAELLVDQERQELRERDADRGIKLAESPPPEVLARPAHEVLAA